MKLTANLKVNIFLIVIILAKYAPFQVNIKQQYVPEILSLLIYIIYLLKKDTFTYINIFFLSLLNDMLKLNYLGVTIIQNFIYVIYIGILKKKYSNNILFDWFSFTVLNIVVLPCKYVIMHFLKNDDMLPFEMVLKKTFVTIVFFPLIYYLVNKFILAKK